MTLSAVRKLQLQLHDLERSLLHPTTPTSADGAATPLGEPRYSPTHSGSRGDSPYDTKGCRSPGPEGAAGGGPEFRVRSLEAESPHRHGRHGSARHPRSWSREQEECRWPHSLSHRSGSQRSPSQGRSKRLPLTYRTSSRRHAMSDCNRNAIGTPSPVGADSEKGPAAHRVLDLVLHGVMLGREGAEPQAGPLKEGRGEASAGKPQPTAPHLSMSKRQLLDEIRREKDEHRKNVRSVQFSA